MAADLESGWYSDETATFGDRLAGAREAAGMTREDLAQRLGVKLTTLSAWEDDIAEPRGNKLQMVAGMLNVSIAWLLTGRGEGVAPPSESPLDPELAGELADTLAEVQTLRAELSACADRLNIVEARLRALMKAA